MQQNNGNDVAARTGIRPRCAAVPGGMRSRDAYDDDACVRGEGRRIANRYAAGSLLRYHCMSIVLTPFARRRLFPADGRRTAILDCTPVEFTQRLNDEAPVTVLEGYAPFCRLHVHRNWTSTRCSVLAIADDNRGHLRSAYEARSREELPVLVRWFEGIEPPVANYLVPILYSREQLAKEGTPIDGEWGIVGCLYTMLPEEMPMAPVTMMRNALGVEEGGSGVPLDREAYRKAVAFWDGHANWRP